jgi:hypothetical protein
MSMSRSPPCLALLSAIVVAAPTSLALAAIDECSIVELGKRINAQEGGKLLDANDDCNEANFSLPLTEGFSITSLEGQVELTFEFKAPPPLGSPAEAKMLRAAVLVTGRARSNADWLIRQCLRKATDAWGNDTDFDYQIPEQLTRLDQQSFRCGRRQQGDVGLQITFHFQNASYFQKDK